MIERTHIPILRSVPKGKAKPRRLPAIKAKRRAQRADYNEQRADFLAAHPFCQIWIARHALVEADVIAADGWTAQGRAPRAASIHHRNKCYGARLTDERWWMAASLPEHDWVENGKRAARAAGYLLPLEADADGRCPDGSQALTTAELLACKARRG